jgi:hypothetical protein
MNSFNSNRAYRELLCERERTNRLPVHAENSTDINSFCSDIHCSRQRQSIALDLQPSKAMVPNERIRFTTCNCHRSCSEFAVRRTLAVHNKKSQMLPMRCYRSKQVMGTRASPKQWSHSRFLEAIILTIALYAVRST